MLVHKPIKFRYGSLGGLRKYQAMKEKVHLDAEQQGYLSSYIRKGKHSVRSIRRARMLLLLHEGNSYSQVARKTECALSSVTYLVNRYREVKGDVKKALTERSRPGQPPVVTSKVEAYVTALACSKAPDGRSEWTMKMIADRVVELEIAPHLCPESVRRTLKKKQAETMAKASLVHL